MKNFACSKPIDPSTLERNAPRIYDVCDGCRRCFNLCPSFNTLLDRIDEYDSDVAKLTPADHHRVVDECYYCKLCFNHCPYARRINMGSTFRFWWCGKRLASERGFELARLVVDQDRPLGATE